jgi:hypothetical protein
MNAMKPSLLIGLAKGFNRSNLFEKKVSALTATLHQFEVSVFQDDRKIAKRYFDKNDIQSKEVNFKKNQFHRELASFSHVIIFWDGDDLTELVFQCTLSKKPIKIIATEITKVRNKDRDEAYDVYIGRGTPWGNPFPIGIGESGDDRDAVIEKYSEYFEREILSDPKKRKALTSLRGYKLGCHCKPLKCHGDIIANYLNSDESYVDD